MPRGLNRLGDFRNGTPVTLPHEFANPVTLPKDFGNPVDWAADPAHFGNPVTWVPDPAHFGNPISSSAGTQPTPTFSPVAGSYSGTQNVTITSLAADAIYYTVDGSTPTTGSILYSAPVAVASSLTLKALAVRAGWDNSAIGSAAYTITASDVTLISSSPLHSAGFANNTTDPIDTTGASLLIAVVSCAFNPLTFVFTDSKGNTWNKLTAYADGSNGGSALIAYAFDHGGSALAVGTGHTLTVNVAGTGDSTVALYAFGNTLTTASVFATGTDKGLSFAVDRTSPKSPGSVTPATGDLVISIIGTNNDITASVAVTVLDAPTSANGDGACLAVGTLISPDGTAKAPSWSWTGDSGGGATAIAVFQHA